MALETNPCFLSGNTITECENVMAKISYLQCDVTGNVDETVQSVSLPIPMAPENGETGEYRIVTLKLDVSSKVLDDVLKGISKAVKPLFTENTTATVKGEAKPKSDDNGETPEPEFGSTEHIRQWGRQNGFTVGDRGALPKTLRKAFDEAIENGTLVKPEETTEETPAE